MAEEGIDWYDDRVLEKELASAMRSEETINLFKVVRDNIQIRNELANTKTLQVVLAQMWGNVADFFDLVCTADNLAMLPVEHELVKKHARMRADFDAVAAINDTFKAAAEAVEELEAEDLARSNAEDNEP